MAKFIGEKKETFFFEDEDFGLQDTLSDIFDDSGMKQANVFF